MTRPLRCAPRTTRALIPGLVLHVSMLAMASAAAPIQDHLVVRWNAQLLAAIKDAKPSPPVVSRMLAVAHTCMYDAWTAFDARAVGVHFNGLGEHRMASGLRSELAKELALSHAAHRCAIDLLPKGATGFDRLLAEIDRKADAAQIAPLLHTKARQLGQAAADAVLAARADDGANDKGQIPCRPAAEVAAYCDHTGYTPVNAGATPIEQVDPDRWQPLPNGKSHQLGLAPHWGQVRPFSFDSAEKFMRDNPIDEARLPKRHGSPAYEAQVQASVLESQRLGYERSGNRKAIVEFWADGPFSYLPPGHFGELAHFVVQRDRMSLDQTVKLFLVLHNASFDAGIVIWHLKYVHDYVRPITAVRHVMRGRTVLAWGGPDTPWDDRPHPVTGQPWGYNRELPGEEWLPYNPTNNPNHPLTPAFPEYVSGHSGFSAASAQALKMVTGSSRFGYEATYDPFAAAWKPTLVEAPELIGVHRWRYPSFVSAANQAGWSRRYGGIHFEDGDVVARSLGKRIGRRTWEKARYYFEGGDANPRCRALQRCQTRDRIPDGTAAWTDLR